MVTLKVELAIVGDAMATNAPAEVARIFQTVSARFGELDSVWSHMHLRDSNGNTIGQVWVEDD